MRRPGRSAAAGRPGQPPARQLLPGGRLGRARRRADPGQRARRGRRRDGEPAAVRWADVGRDRAGRADRDLRGVGTGHREGRVPGHQLAGRPGRRISATSCGPPAHERRDPVAGPGLPLEAAFSASKLRWLLGEVPGAHRRAAAGELLFGDVNCWLTWHLTGGAAHITEPSMAARTMLFDLAGRAWSAELLDLFGVPAAMLPPIAPDRRAAGRHRPGGLRRAGRDRRQHRRPARSPCSASAAGSAGQAKLTLGTGAFLWCHAGGTVPPAAVPGAAGGVVASVGWRLPGDAAYALEGFVPNSGGVLSWLRQLGVLPSRGQWPVYHAPMRCAGPRRRAVACVPALFGLGTPHWGTRPARDITGLTAASTGSRHRRGRAARRRSPGRGCHRGRPGRAARADGAGPGGRRAGRQRLARSRPSPTWPGSRLDRPAVTEVTALGAGALAGLGNGRVGPGGAGRRCRGGRPLAAACCRPIEPRLVRPPGAAGHGPRCAGRLSGGCGRAGAAGRPQRRAGPLAGGRRRGRRASTGHRERQPDGPRRPGR